MEKIVALILCGIFLLTRCADENVEYVETEGTTLRKVSDENVESVEIENTTFDLVSDNGTGIIYIKNLTRDPYYVYTPYYSKNGKLCRYDDGKIVEVEE